MGHTKVSIVADAPLENLYALGMDVAETPEVFPNIVKIRIIERSSDKKYMKAEWTARVRVLTLERTMSWIQEDRWDDNEMCCRFNLAKEHTGPIKHLGGTWWFKPHSKGTEMVFDSAFKLSHPIVTPRIHQLVDMVMRKNNESLLKAIKSKAEKGKLRK